jgi:V8-like Glu-specific endopeptidase
MDIFDGDSGGGVYDYYNYQLIGVQSTENISWWWGFNYYNEATAFNSTWYWWFSSTGVWP